VLLSFSLRQTRWELVVSRFVAPVGFFLAAVWVAALFFMVGAH
jgi:hypothetical protein